MALLANRYVRAAIGLLAVVAALWAFGAWRHHQGVTETQTAARIAAYEQYEAEVAKINAATYDLQAKITELSNAKPKVVIQYRDRVVASPLPADCVIDAGRLSGIQSALGATRPARQPSGAVP